MTTPNGRFHEIVEAIKNPSEEGIDPSIYDDLTAEYASTFESYTESVRARDDRIAELESKVGTLKSQNFDLLMKVDTGASTPEDQTNEVESTPTIETLFTKKR
jgi:hypothetical protein